MTRKSSKNVYLVSIRGGVRRATIGVLTPKIAKALSKIDPDDDEDLREYVEDLDDAFFAYAVSAEAFTLSVTKEGSTKEIFSANQDEAKLKREIKETLVEKPGIYVSTTQNERGLLGSYSLALGEVERFDPSLLTVVGVWPKDTSAGPLITEIHYNGIALESDDDHETEVTAFQVDFFEVEPFKTGSKQQKRHDLTIDQAIAKSKS